MTQFFYPLLATAFGQKARAITGAYPVRNEVMLSGRGFVCGLTSIEEVFEDRRMDAIEIIEQMHQKYAKCSSYQDSGIVRLPLLSFGAEIRFKTFFIRPNKFRLDWQQYKAGIANSSGSIWTDGNRVNVRSPKGEEEKDTLRQAIVMSEEVTAGTSTAVPTLLIPFADKYVLTDLKKVYRVSDDTTPACFCIRGWSKQDDDTQLWIDRETFVLKRMRVGVGQKTKQPFEFMLNLMARRYGLPVNLASIVDTTMQQH